MMGHSVAHTAATATGLEALLGGRAKSGIVRALASTPRTRLSELIGTVGMSKSAVSNALAQLELSGAVRTSRRGREIIVEAADRDMLLVLVSFDQHVHRQASEMPVPREGMDDAALLAMERFFAEPVGTVARISQSHASEEGMPVSEEVWRSPQGLAA